MNAGTITISAFQKWGDANFNECNAFSFKFLFEERVSKSLLLIDCFEMFKQLQVKFIRFTLILVNNVGAAIKCLELQARIL